MNDDTPVTALAHEWNFIFRCKQHIIHDPREPEKSTAYVIKMFRVNSGAYPLNLIHRRKSGYYSHIMVFRKMFAFKDARSVSLYPYNQSQILQYV